MKRTANSRAFRRVEDAATHIFIQIYAGNTRRFARRHPGDRRGDGRCDTAGSAIFPARKFFHTQVRFLQADVFADKEQGKSPEERESNIYANRQTEIKINQEYFEKMGISLNENEDVPEEKMETAKVDIKVDLDADYFQWKEGKEIENKAKASKEKSDRFQNMLKGFTKK